MNYVHYNITGGAIKDAVDSLMRDRETQGAKLEALCKEVGSEPGEYWGNERHITSLKFEKHPGPGWKQEGGYQCYSPKGSSKEARALRKRISECAIPGMEALGRLINSGIMFSGMRIYYPSLEVLDDVILLGLPEISTFTPPDDGCVPLKESEYWAIKEAHPKMEDA